MIELTEEERCHVNEAYAIILVRPGREDYPTSPVLRIPSQRKRIEGIITDTQKGIMSLPPFCLGYGHCE